MLNPRYPCLALLLLVAPAEVAASSLRSHAPGPKDEVACCTTCHRFGMKLLAEWKTDFVGVTSPVTCCDVCKNVFAGAATPTAAPAAALQAAPAMTAVKCKTICHRFGMKSLGGEFASLTSPVDCAAKCDQKYT